MRDEHFSTIPKTESDELIKSSVENLVPIPREFEDVECDLPVNDKPSPISTTFSNPLFDSNDDFSSSDDESLSNDDVPNEIFKIYSNPLVDEEIIFPKIDPHSLNAESSLIDSMLKSDILIDSSPKFDYLLEEFSGELAPSYPIPPRIIDNDFEREEEFRLNKNGSYENSSPEERNAEIPNTSVESPSPLPVADSDSHMEEIDLFLASDNLMPLGIENDLNDLEGDILYPEALFHNDSNSLPETESFALDNFDDSSLSRPLLKPPNEEIFDAKPNPGNLISKGVGHISELYVPLLLSTRPTLYFDPEGGENVVFPNVEDDDSFTFTIRTFLPFVTYPAVSPFLPSTGSEDKRQINSGSSQARDSVIKNKRFSDFPDFEDSRARGFVPRSLDLLILSFILGIPYP
ncbi:hypothetical protein Tco_1519929 [Tanacetum coccineum]